MTLSDDQAIQIFLDDLTVQCIGCEGSRVEENSLDVDMGTVMWTCDDCGELNEEDYGN